MKTLKTIINYILLLIMVFVYAGLTSTFVIVGLSAIFAPIILIILLNSILPILLYLLSPFLIAISVIVIVYLTSTLTTSVDKLNILK